MLDSTTAVGQYTIGCLYGDLWGMGACAYTINGAGAGIVFLNHV